MLAVLVFLAAPIVAAGLLAAACWLHDRRGDRYTRELAHHPVPTRTVKEHHRV
ncbi:hypothetical protein [Streptomyces chilikensis]|uniref:Secreted protein n=1 Tax=Streptomyces chilikensis TaxID=1194079 RepID=A0ABV3ERC4_9ACTN